MGQNFESSLNIADESNILTQLTFLKVVLASLCEHLKEYSFVMIYGGKCKKYWKSQEILKEEKVGTLFC